MRPAGDDQRLATRDKLQSLDLDVEPQQSLADQGQPELDSSRLQRGPEGRLKAFAMRMVAIAILRNRSG
jgi:hypothetical protein